MTLNRLNSVIYHQRQTCLPPVPIRKRGSIDKMISKNSTKSTIKKCKRMIEDKDNVIAIDIIWKMMKKNKN